MPLPELETLPELPLDEDGPVFAAPWQAQAFALVVGLQEQGAFSWQEWTEQLGRTIARARAQGDPDLGNTYYEHWLTTLENLAFHKGLADPELVAARKQRIHEEQQKLHAPKA